MLPFKWKWTSQVGWNNIPIKPEIWWWEHNLWDRYIFNLEESKSFPPVCTGFVHIQTDAKIKNVHLNVFCCGQIIYNLRKSCFYLGKTRRALRLGETNSTRRGTSLSCGLGQQAMTKLTVSQKTLLTRHLSSAHLGELHQWQWQQQQMSIPWTVATHRGFPYGCDVSVTTEAGLSTRAEAILEATFWLLRAE